MLETVNNSLTGSSTRCQVNSISDSKPTIYDGNTSNTIKLFHNFDWHTLYIVINVNTKVDRLQSLLTYTVLGYPV